MKTTTKILIALGTLVFGGIIYHQIKKEKKELDELDKSRIKQLEDAGINEEIAEKCSAPLIDEGNMVKSIFTGVTSDGADWDQSMFLLDETLECSHIIHLTQSISEKHNSPFLDFLFEIPRSAYRGKSNSYAPRVGDYIKTLGRAAEHMDENIVKSIPRAHHELAGYFVITYINGDRIRCQILTKIPKCCYNMYATEVNGKKRDGLTDFCQYYNEGRINANDLMNNHGNEILKECCQSFAPNQKNEPWDEIGIIGVVLTWKISFPIADSYLGGNPSGMTLEKAFTCLRYITELKIYLHQDEDKYCNSGVEYRQIMFNAYNPELGAFDLMSGYEFDKNKEIVTQSIGY